ncbi:MAG TPA: RNA polymerase sigma factor [Bacteroidaceae bacterium]|nr:RNA polymerase sigma factor [Bacteroidaceae bacterium]
MYRDLIEACRKGSRTAQFRIYELYYKAMYNTALRIVNDPDDAEDVMQEAFLKAFQKLDTFLGEVSFGAWLKKIVINKSLDFIKLKKSTVSFEELELDLILTTDTEGEQETEMIDKINADEIKKAIRDLPAGYRIVLSLYLLEGYDHEEISSILNISEVSSRTQYHRAKKKLLELLKRKQ